jgi:hypothetical protein
MPENPLPLDPSAPTGLGPATEALWKVYVELNEWVRFADAKAGAILAADMVIVSLLPGALFSKEFRPFATTGSTLAAVAAILGCLGLLASAVLCLWCIKPRIKSRPAGPASLIFFSHIAEGHDDADAFARAARDFDDPEKAYLQISRQVWANAWVADRKHDAVRRAVYGLMFGLAFGVVAWALALERAWS